MLIVGRCLETERSLQMWLLSRNQKKVRPPSILYHPPPTKQKLADVVAVLAYRSVPPVSQLREPAEAAPADTPGLDLQVCSFKLTPLS